VHGKLALVCGITGLTLGALAASGRATAVGRAFTWLCVFVGAGAILVATLAAASAEEIVVDRAIELEARRSGERPAQVRPRVEDQFRFGLVEVSAGGGTAVVVAGGALIAAAGALSALSRRSIGDPDDGTAAAGEHPRT